MQLSEIKKYIYIKRNYHHYLLALHSIFLRIYFIRMSPTSFPLPWKTISNYSSMFISAFTVHASEFYQKPSMCTAAPSPPKTRFFEGRRGLYTGYQKPTSPWKMRIWKNVSKRRILSTKILLESSNTGWKRSIHGKHHHNDSFLYNNFDKNAINWLPLPGDFWSEFYNGSNKQLDCCNLYCVFRVCLWLATTIVRVWNENVSEFCK